MVVALILVYYSIHVLLFEVVATTLVYIHELWDIYYLAFLCCYIKEGDVLVLFLEETNVG